MARNDFEKRSRISMGLIQQLIKNRILTLLLKTKAATLIGERQNTRLKWTKFANSVDEEPPAVR